jgi:hypothetical protein
MAKWTAYYSIRIYTQGAKKRFRNSTKPYWNDNLQRLWDEVRSAENQYLQCSQTKVAERRKLRETFVATQHTFDSVFRRVKHKFEKEKRDDIERLNTENPREFWNHLNNLGPKRACDIPFEVYTSDGRVSTDSAEVLDKWKTDFKELLNKEHTNANFDENFYNEALLDKQRLEAQVLLNDNRVLNGPYTAT